MPRPFCKKCKIPKKKRSSDSKWVCPQCPPPKKSLLSPAAEKVISRWAENEFYVYIRPTTSKFLDKKSEHSVYWVVQVEYRTMPPGYWKAEGYVLNDLIRQLDREVPRRRGQHRINQADHPGLTAPERLHEQAKKRARAKRTSK